MKQLLIAFVLLITTSSITAQNEWPKEGAQWEICDVGYYWDSGDFYNNNSTVRYTRDTLINDVNYQVSEQFYHNGDLGAKYFTRFENDSIFRLINEKEYMFFTYNTTIGDTLFMKRTGFFDYNEDTCSFSLELKCTEIFDLNINGESYTYWEFQDVGNSIFGTNYEGPSEEGAEEYSIRHYWLERVGWVDYFPWATQPDEHICNSFIWDGENNQFPFHYSDIQIDIDIPNQSICDTTLQVVKDKMKENYNFDVFPNPSSSEITIVGLPQDNYTFQVSDNLGRVVLKGELTNEKIDISNLKSGVYMLKIARENQLFYTSKIIKE